MGKTRRGLAASCGAVVVALGFAAPARAWDTPVWIRQLGTSGNEHARDVTTDEHRKIFVVGDAEGALFGPNGGSADWRVAEFDATGHRLWAQQIGTGQYESASGVATDADGNVYVVGSL